MPLSSVAFPSACSAAHPKVRLEMDQGHISLQHTKPRLKMFLSSKASHVSDAGTNAEAPRQTHGRSHVSRFHETISVFCCRSNSSSRHPLDHRKETTATGSMGTSSNCVGTTFTDML